MTNALFTHDDLKLVLVEHVGLTEADMPDDAEAALADLGLDSLAVIELHVALGGKERVFGPRLEPNQKHNAPLGCGIHSGRNCSAAAAVVGHVSQCERQPAARLAGPDDLVDMSAWGRRRGSEVARCVVASQALADMRGIAGLLDLNGG
jgi:hypothetical protein